MSEDDEEERREPVTRGDLALILREVAHAIYEASRGDRRFCAYHMRRLDNVVTALEIGTAVSVQLPEEEP